MDTVNSIKNQILAAFESKPSIVEQTAKQVISIEREYFYGDSQNNQRLRRIRNLLSENFTEFEKEQEGVNETA